MPTSIRTCILIRSYIATPTLILIVITISIIIFIIIFFMIISSSTIIIIFITGTTTLSAGYSISCSPRPLLKKRCVRVWRCCVRLLPN